MKHLLSIIILVFICLNCNAQLNRTIWGCTLGKSTKQEVKGVIFKKGYIIDKETDTEITIYKKGIRFGGIDWYSVSFVFVNGTFARIFFMSEFLPYSDINAYYENIGLSLYEKYGAYYELPSSKSPGTVRYSQYFDEKTFIGLSMEKADYGDYYLSMVYSDHNLFNTEQQNNRDEL